MLRFLFPFEKGILMNNNLSGITPTMEKINTKRLCLEPLELRHTKSLFDLYQDPELFCWIRKNPPSSRQEFTNGICFLEKRLSRDKSEYWLNWVAANKESSEIVTQIEVSLHRERRHAHLAYTTFRKFWKNGFAKEACTAVVDHLFSKWNVSKIVIEMDTRNEASIRLAESLGAKRVGFKAKAEFFKDTWSDEYTYEIAFAPAYS